jgi:tetratricopeptide (TPR) repeat protein
MELGNRTLDLHFRTSEDQDLTSNPLHSMHLRTIAMLLGLLPLVVSCSDAPVLDDFGAGQETFTSQRDQVHMAQARRYLAAGETAKARKELQGLSTGAQNASMHLLLAEADLRENRINSAMESINSAADLEPTNPEVDMLRGLVFESTGNWLDASRAYLTASNKDRDNTVPVLANARVLHAQGDVARAASYLERELAARPIDFDLSIAAGDAFMAVGSHFDAITHYSTAVDMQPEHLPARQALVLALSLAGMHVESLERSQDLEVNELKPMIRLAVGRSALLANKPQRAASMLTSYLFEFEKDDSAWLDLARAYFLSDKQDLAISAVGRVLKIRPQDPSAFTLLGHIRLRSGQHDLAFAAYEHAILAGGDAILLTELMDRAEKQAAAAKNKEKEL